MAKSRIHFANHIPKIKTLWIDDSNHSEDLRFKTRKIENIEYRLRFFTSHANTFR